MKHIYDKVYNSQADDNGQSLKNYGSVNHAGPVQQYILDLKPESVLDIGCGKAQFVDLLRSKGIITDGVDIVQTAYYPFKRIKSLKIVVADARDLPFPEDKFTIVTAFDVLEHFSESDIDVVLAEAKRVAKNMMIFSICFRDSIFRIEGESLHRTVRPHEWWFERLREYGKVKPWDIQPTYGFYIVEL